MPIDILMVELEQDSSGLELPALQSPAIATYKGLWILIGGRKSGVHSMDNDPPSFNKLANNDTIWVINIAEKKESRDKSACTVLELPFRNQSFIYPGQLLPLPGRWLYRF